MTVDKDRGYPRVATELKRIGEFWRVARLR